MEALKRVGWEPTNDILSARYWISLRQWDKCIDVGEAAVTPLRKNMLNHQDSDARNAAASTLASMGSLAYDTVIIFARSSDGVIRRKVCDILDLWEILEELLHLINC